MSSTLDKQIKQLSRLTADDRDLIRALSAKVRRAIEAAVIPGDLAAAITQSFVRLSEQTACAVRSSATAEDSPTASSPDRTTAT